MYRQITVLTLLICFLAAPAQAAQMSVEPAYQEAFQGDNITVDITVYPEESWIYGASYTLYFNNTVLNATLQETGPFLTQDGEESIIYNDNIDNTIGEIIYTEARKGTLVEVNTPGVLATITFQVIGEEGISPLNLSDLDGELLYSVYSGSITPTLNNGSAEISKGICGDVDGYPGVTTNDGWLIYMNLTFPSDPRYTLTSAWAADCDGYSGVTTNDGWLIYMNLTFPGDLRYLLGCC